MSDLRSRAVACLGGPQPLSRRAITVMECISRYVAGETFDDTESRDQLSLAIQAARSAAAQCEGDSGPAADTRFFYERAATILQEIQSEISAGQD